MKYEIIGKNYGSPRISREFLDCSMPFTFDQYNNCGYTCLYCFSTFQRAIGASAANYLAKKVKTVSLKSFKKIFEDLDNPKNMFAPFIKNRITMQWGGMSDPLCPIEEQEGVGYEILSYLKEKKYPICFSSKSDLLIRSPKYFDLFRGMEKYWSYKASIITLDEKKASILEAGTPSPQSRIDTLKALSDIGIWTIWRLRPFIIGVSNLDYEKQMEEASKAGCKAVSTEFFCLEIRAVNIAKDKFKTMSDVTGFDIVQFYQNISVTQGYKRLNRAIKEPYYRRMKELCDKYGMNFHISDCHGKELGCSGSCCGLPADKDGNPSLTNYSRFQFTEALQIAKKKGTVSWDDFCKNDFWATTIQTDKIYHAGGVGELEKKCRVNIYQFILNEWNNPKSGNSPYKYFGSSGRKSPAGKELAVMEPFELDTSGNIIYKFNKRV